MTMLLFSETSLSRSGSVSPPGSPDTPPREEKFCPSPTKTDQKPFRGFDITSLIRKDDDKDGCDSVNLLIAFCFNTNSRFILDLPSRRESRLCQLIRLMGGALG